MDIKKENRAIEILKTFEPSDSEYYVCYSGGKDSDVIRILCQLAGVKHSLHYQYTTADAPETVYYVRSVGGVQMEHSRYSDGSFKTMWNLIPRKGFPPTRLIRYCCSNLKESAGRGLLKVTGVRWAESNNRKNNADTVGIWSSNKKIKQLFERSSRQYRINKSGGIILNYDNETARDDSDIVHQCFQDHSVTINPIIDWTDRDVWEFLLHYGCTGNPLYSCGFSRVGCIGCPLGGSRSMEREFARYPRFKAMYIHAFDRMLKNSKTFTNWKNGVDVFNWWIGDDTIEGQLSFFDEEELYNFDEVLEVF